MTPTSEERITIALQKITQKLGKCFLENVEHKCSHIRSKDATWFNNIVQDIVADFQKNSSEACAAVLSQYDINNKEILLEQANKTLNRTKSWRPSGDPEIDIRAHLLPLNKSYMENLSSYSQELDSELGRRSEELRRLRQTLYDEVIEFRSLAEKLQNLSKSTKSCGTCTSEFQESPNSMLDK
ncbi:unnamed protein product [Schistosoma bovis]|uniref:Polyamine-modulated factor 1 n=1 Tax=Schistosoma bovis TaxID=6184 RepID=A0A430QIT5_SCHBO|nr:uncharacterized protein DC041_0005556 [Schistosoma bovis]CAH8471037.1 unnamed protein product [Schistosoma bovis]CAH8472170.1 unnamed protein product [Schistosoma bovis]